ncbi:MAG: two-component system nitrogen regulation response regulator NtrX, partial [Roseivirga sp.]
KTISERGIAELQQYDWSGNIRELRNVTERLVIMAGDVISEDDVKKYLI